MIIHYVICFISHEIGLFLPDTKGTPTLYNFPRASKQWVKHNIFNSNDTHVIEYMNTSTLLLHEPNQFLHPTEQLGSVK